MGGKSGSRLGLEACVRPRPAFHDNLNYKAGPGVQWWRSPWVAPEGLAQQVVREYGLEEGRNANPGQGQDS